MLQIYLVGICLGADTVFTKRRRVSISNISLTQGVADEKMLASVRNLWDVRIWQDNFWALSQNCEKRLLASSYPSVRLSWNNVAPTGRIFMKLDIRLFFDYLSRKFN